MNHEWRDSVYGTWCTASFGADEWVRIIYVSSAASLSGAPLFQFNFGVASGLVSDDAIDRAFTEECYDTGIRRLELIRPGVRNYLPKKSEFETRRAFYVLENG